MKQRVITYLIPGQDGACRNVVIIGLRTEGAKVCVELFNTL